MMDVRKRYSALLFYTMVIALFLFGTLLGNQAIATISEMVPIERLHRIVIDPGHGGWTAAPYPVPERAKAILICKLLCGSTIFCTFWAMTP